MRNLFPGGSVLQKNYLRKEVCLGEFRNPKNSSILLYVVVQCTFVSPLPPMHCKACKCLEFQ